MLTIRQSMELAGENLLANLAPDHNYMPYWSLWIDADLRAFSKAGGAAHNVGRWWDAMLRLEACTGFVIPPQCEAAMLQNLRRCFDNPLDLCRHLDAEGGKDGGFDNHSPREMLLTLSGLWRWRRNRWALDQGRRFVRSLDRFIRDDGRLAWEDMRRGWPQVGEEPAKEIQSFPISVRIHGRAIEGLSEFYRVSGDGAALGLAERLARLHFANSTRADGTAPFVPDHGLHTHSFLNTLRGLLRVGEQTRQQHYIERVAAMYRVAVCGMVRESGFISHDWGSELKGDTASAGDAAQIALWLGRHGYSEFLDAAQRWIRVRVLGSQLTTSPGLMPGQGEGAATAAKCGTEADLGTELDRRALGAYGGILRHHPHGGIIPTTDVTAADLHTLCDIYTHIAERTAAGLRLNFHFDYADEAVRIHCEDGESRTVSVALQVPQNLFVRVPRWTPSDSVEMRVDGAASGVEMRGDFAFVPAGPAEIVLRYELPRRQVVESTDGVDYHFTWRGDDIVGVKPNADFLGFYPTSP